MSITVTEASDSRLISVGDDATATLIVYVQGTIDDLAAWQAVLAWSDSTFRDLVRRSVGIRPVYIDAGNADGSRWIGEIVYGRRQIAPAVGQDGIGNTGYLYQFDTSGGSEHITQSLQTVGAFGTKGIPAGGGPPAPATVSDYGGAIGVERSAEGLVVRGLDKPVAGYAWTETHYLPALQFTNAYKRILAKTSKKVNAASFRGWPRGEVFFDHATGGPRSIADWEVTFHFAWAEHVRNRTIGDITGVAKDAWNWIWTMYTEEEDEDDVCLVARPEAAYVERVFEYADFSLLGIGVGP